MRLIAGLMLAAVAARPSFAQRTAASPAEADYLRQLAKYHYQFTHSPFGDSTLRIEQLAVKELEARLRPIVGPFAVAGFAQPGVANNGDLFEADEDFDAADGIKYRIAGEKSGAPTVAVVTTEPILRAWLKRRADIDSTVPLDAAFAKANVLTWAFDFGAAAEPYAQIPRDTLRSLGLTWGWLGGFEQDDCICAARHAVFMVQRGQQLVLVALRIEHQIKPSQTCIAANKPAHDGEMNRGDDFRSCYGREVVRDPRFGMIVSQIREMVSRLRRP